MKASELKRWRRLGKGVTEVIKAVTQKYYADCYNTEGDMQRLMLWEGKIRKELGEG